ncbi:AraC family transcriptional regulator [Paenibacillus roseipurpureus]|uniref:AraC family transcriptional regulator n=1 Tax=Paenibacillus roseopurpureus TaxID=2918901 RepID=A0AA96RLT3_9BACL|nr:AraC family transcriptional regulator [Paenibacillus sp. MBLB1832]WNR45754.1 AraC family transcriptional regulator [Paenibacillus sp. MBLB1832]
MSLEGPIVPGGDPRWNREVEERLKEFPIHIQLDEPITQTTWHQQPGVEIHITSEGRAAFVSGDHFWVQKARRVIVHRGGQPHRFIGLAEKTFKRTVVCFDPDVWMGLSEKNLLPLMALDWLREGEPLQLELDVEAYARIQEQARVIEQELRMKSEGWRELGLAKLLEMVVLLKRMSSPVFSKPEDDQQVSALVQHSIEYALQHLEEELTLARMAKRFAISEEHLTRSFTREIGTSFHRFLIAARISKSCELMTEKLGMPISDIALQVGYSTLAHYSHMFKQITGMSPTQYRKEWTSSLRKS